MKHIKKIWALSVCSLLLCSCGTANAAMIQTAKVPIAEETAEPEIIRTESYAQFAEAAESVEALYEQAEVVLEFDSGEVSAKVINDLVYTIVTPQNVTVYKGDYDGAQIASVGGEINLQTYFDSISADAKNNINGYTEEQKANTVFQEVMSGCILVQSNTRYLFFGKKGDERYGGMYVPMFTHQGYYACDDSCIWLERNMIAVPMREELTEAFAVPERDTETQLAVDKESVLDAMM